MLHFKPSLEALSLQSDVIRSTKILARREKRVHRQGKMTSKKGEYADEIRATVERK